MEFKIPSTLQIGGVDITVEKVQNILNAEVLWQCCIGRSNIEIADAFNGIKQSESSKLNTFFHELTHCILDTMGERELSDNEKFVCAFSSFLTEAIKSMK